MHRRSVLKMAAIPALLSVARPGYAQQRQRVTYAYLLDPAYDAVTWAMRNGKVASSLIEVEARGLAIPQLIQATSAKQYDVIMAAVVSLPAAKDRGLDVRVLAAALRSAKAGEGSGVWVPRDSPIKTPQDLKGKVLGSYGLRSTGYTQIRIALNKKYGLNMALEEGDVQQVEIQAPNLPAALSTGKVDAATLIHSQAYRALHSGEYRLVAETARDNNEIFKMQFVSAVNIAYPERLAKQPEAYVEFCRVFRESQRYALANRDEVFGAMSKESGLDPAFFEWWFTRNSEVPGYFGEEHAQAIMKFYELARDMGVLKSFSDVRSQVWDQAPRA